MDTESPTLPSLVREYLKALRVRNYTTETVKGRERYLRYFLEWAREQAFLYPEQITRPVLLSYQKYLAGYLRKDNGELLVTDSQIKRVSAVTGFFGWLTKQDHISSNPATEIEFHRNKTNPFKITLSAKEAEDILKQPDLEEPLGIRDRAMLEILYSTGIRRMELKNLHIYDIDMSAGVLIIRQGKGQQDRMVPIGKKALRWIDKYLSKVRSHLVKEPDSQVLFLGRRGAPLSKASLTRIVGLYIRMATDKDGACHLFRHSTATLMLKNGADVQCIQKMLGHSSLLTTQLYTSISEGELKEIHQKTHPTSHKAKKGKGK